MNINKWKFRDILIMSIFKRKRIKRQQIKIFHKYKEFKIFSNQELIKLLEELKGKIKIGILTVKNV